MEGQGDVRTLDFAHLAIVFNIRRLNSENSLQPGPQTCKIREEPSLLFATYAKPGK
jgi:hypothetical protein